MYIHGFLLNQTRLKLDQNTILCAECEGDKVYPSEYSENSCLWYERQSDPRFVRSIQHTWENQKLYYPW